MTTSEELRAMASRPYYALNKTFFLSVAAELEALQKENQTLRNAQKICEDCDAPTLYEFKQLRAEVEKLQDEADKEHAKAVELCAKLIYERQLVAELKRDSERLSHAIERGYLDAIVEDCTGTQESVRSAIDAAMKEKP